MQQVSQIEGVELPNAVHYARVVIKVLSEAISLDEVNDISSQLPLDYDSVI